MSTANIQEQRLNALGKPAGFAARSQTYATQIGSFGIPFVSSVIIHALIIQLGSLFIHQADVQRREFFAVNLIELPTLEVIRPERKLEAQPETKEVHPPPRKIEKPKSAARTPAIKSQPAPPPVLKQEPEKSVETAPLAPVIPEPAPGVTPVAPTEGGGSEAGAGQLFENGDIAVVPGKGTAGGGGGTATSGLGRGSGAPGLPATPLRTNREAKPIQTVRANYPPMALRAGLESDVVLRIEIDSQGKVTKAEVTKSGGMGFDEEALKAVQQSRFEPAQQNGQNVPAEFTYIYRFRLRR
jgi:protein TonB